MSTWYILAGGADTKNNPGYWKKLRSTIQSEKPLHILSCQFAQPEDEWQERFKSFESGYFKQGFGEDMTCELADPDNLKDQIKKADVIYLHGGSTAALRKVMDKVPNIQELWKDKIVIGSSAGAHYLTKFHWTPGDRVVRRGAGFVPLNIISHYGSDYGSDEPEGPIDWEKANQELQTAIGDQEVTPIPEGDFVEFSV